MKEQAPVTSTADIDNLDPVGVSHEGGLTNVIAGVYAAGLICAQFAGDNISKALRFGKDIADKL